MSERDLTPNERAVYDLRHQIADLTGGPPPAFKELMISETIRPSAKEGMNLLLFLHVSHACVGANLLTRVGAIPLTRLGASPLI